MAQEKQTRREWLASTLAGVAGFAAGFGLSEYANDKDELRMPLPLQDRPNWLQYDDLGDASQFKIKFEQNYLKAFRERYEKLHIEASVARSSISDVIDLSSLSPGVPRVYRLPPAPLPDYIPMKIWGIKKNGAKELIFTERRPPRAPAGSF